MKTLIIDYGMGNLGSVTRALEECGAPGVEIARHPHRLDEASYIVLPGVGAFRQGMQNLEQGGWTQAIRAAVEDRKIPILGICLGMQLMAERGWEGGESKGLGLLPGEVRRLIPSEKEKRLPHIGWNEVKQQASSRLFEGIPDLTDFYFVHSYHFHTAEQFALGKTSYAEFFHSVVARDHVWGVQFHPEKSQKAGFQLLKNFLKYSDAKGSHA